MQIDVLTIFPEMFESPLSCSVVKRAIAKGVLEVRFHDIRSYADDPYHSVDDYPYGGGDGMVMKVEPIVAAIRHAKSIFSDISAKVILLSPQGKKLSQEILGNFSTLPRLIIICGHYGGVDERIRAHYVDEEISIGDYVLTGGELPAMVLIEGIARLLPGVLGNIESAGRDSFQEPLLECPQYTRPVEFEVHAVPDVLLSGDHAKIAKWRRTESIRRTLEKRPDLIEEEILTEEDRKILEKLKK